MNLILEYVQNLILKAASLLIYFNHDENTTITTFSRFAQLRLRRGAISIGERMTQILNGF